MLLVHTTSEYSFQHHHEFMSMIYLSLLSWGHHLCTLHIMFTNATWIRWNFLHYYSCGSQYLISFICVMGDLSLFSSELVFMKMALIYSFYFFYLLCSPLDLFSGCWSHMMFAPNVTLAISITNQSSQKITKLGSNWH